MGKKKNQGAHTEMRRTDKKTANHLKQNLVVVLQFENFICITCNAFNSVVVFQTILKSLPSNKILMAYVYCHTSI